MFLSIYTIKDCKVRLESSLKQMKKNNNIEYIKTFNFKFYEILYDLELGLYESYILSYNSSFQSCYYEVNRIINKISKINESEEYIKSIEEVLELIDKLNIEKDYYIYENGYMYTYHYNYCNYRRKMHLNSKDIFDNIFENNIVFNNRDVNIFMPDCYNAESKEFFDKIKDKTLKEVKIYGNESSSNFGGLSKAKERLYKVVKGPLKGSRIQNNSFDIIFVDPIIDNDYNTYAPLQNKEEKKYISEMYKYLRDDGIFILQIPFYRLYKGLCASLSKALNNIQIFKSHIDDFNKYGIIYIIGQKNVSEFIKEDEYKKLRRCYNIENIKNFYDMDFKSYTLKQQFIDIELFKGSLLDIDEIKTMFEQSKMLENSFNSQKIKKTDENIRKPLLPFNIGQLGLVLTSGCLDGIVEEKDGNCHLIKGRVSKQVIQTETNIRQGLNEVTETTVNKVEINVLLPNGEFKTLA